MTAAQNSDTADLRHPLVSSPQPPPQYVIVLPPYLPRRRLLRRSSLLRPICSAAAVLLLLAAAYVLWPSDPKLSVVRLSLDRLHFHTSPQISLDVTLGLTVRVWNKDFYSIDYDSLVVGVGYRGRRLGSITSDGGRIGARRSSYVNATLQLDGAEVLSDAIWLLEDLAKGAIAFDTESEISGKIEVLFFDLPLKAKISCEAIVNTRNQTIVRQNCYPE